MVLDTYISKPVFIECCCTQQRVDWLFGKIGFTLEHFITCLTRLNSLNCLNKWVVIKEDHVNEIKKFDAKSRQIIWHHLVDFNFDLPCLSEFGNINKVLRTMLNASFEAILFTKCLKAYLYFGLNPPKNVLQLALKNENVNSETIKCYAKMGHFSM